MISPFLIAARTPLLSFFTGGGFLDLGFERVGFNIAWTNEVNPVFADIHDFAHTRMRQAVDPKSGPVSISDRRSIVHITAPEILEQAFGEKRPRVFGIIGGPPCTDFSRGGVNAGSTGSNGRLTGVYVSKLLQLEPTFFVIENVPALQRSPTHGAYFGKKLRQLGKRYHLHVKVLNALEFGAPQDRHRLFVVGVRKDADPEATDFEWPHNAKFAGARNLAWPGETPFGAEMDRPEDLPTELMVETAFGGKGGLEDLPNGGEWFQPYSSKFGSVPEGCVKTKSFKRLHRYRYSPTAWYGNNEVHLHPTQPRRISVREALRLQTVPDSYILPEDAPLCAKFKVACNGVPVVLAAHIAGAICQHLDKIGVKAS